MRRGSRLRGGLRVGRVWCLVVVAVGFAAPSAVADPVGQITEFSTGLNAGSRPPWIAPGPDGNLWFTDQGSTHAIGRINPSTGQISEFSLGLNPGSSPTVVAPGPDGNVWFTDQGTTSAIGRINPSTGQISEFSLGLNPGSRPNWIAPGTDGNVWFTDDGTTSAIGRIIPSTGRISEFSSGLNPGSFPEGIAPGADGNLWFTDQGKTSAIGRIIPSTAQISESSSGLNPSSILNLIAPGADGNLWFTDRGENAIGRLNPFTGQISEFPMVNVTGLPVGIASGADGNLWVTAEAGNTTIERINPFTRQITEFSSGLNPGRFVRGIAPGADGNVWFADLGSMGAIGRIGAGAPAAVAVPPVLSGSGQAGAPEFCQTSFSSWAGVAPSASLLSFDGYRWLRDGALIAGQNGQTYVPSGADVGHRLACSETVTYPLPFLVTAPASSLPVTVQPGVSPPPPPPVPVVSALKLSPRSFSLAGRKVGRRCVKPTARNRRRPACTRPVALTISYTLNTATMVTFTIAATLPGRKLGGRCVAQTRKNHKHKKCTRHVTLPGSTAQAGEAGANSLLLGRKLGPGSYTLTATPTGGVPQQITFKIIP